MQVYGFVVNKKIITMKSYSCLMQLVFAAVLITVVLGGPHSLKNHVTKGTIVDRTLTEITETCMSNKAKFAYKPSSV